MRIIVAHEKHDPNYYDATGWDAWVRSSLEILRQRLEDGWYDPEMYGSVDETILELTDDDIAVMPEGLREDAVKIRDRARRDAKDYAEAKTFYDEVENALERYDLAYHDIRGEPRAWRLLQRRRDYEYELVTLEEVVTWE